MYVRGAAREYESGVTPILLMVQFSLYVQKRGWNAFFYDTLLLEISWQEEARYLKYAVMLLNAQYQSTCLIFKHCTSF